MNDTSIKLLKKRVHSPGISGKNSFNKNFYYIYMIVITLHLQHSTGKIKNKGQPRRAQYKNAVIHSKRRAWGLEIREECTTAQEPSSSEGLGFWRAPRDS